MYMLVYVPLQDRSDEDSGWRIGEEVITDLKGNRLTREEIAIRNQMKSLQKSGKALDAKFSATDISLPSPAASPEADSVARAANDRENGFVRKSCCAHKKELETGTVNTVSSRTEPDKAEKFTPTQWRPQCNCGPDCSCAFCLEHPNNKTSQRIAQQQVAHFAGQVSSAELNGLDDRDWQTSTHMSCMGTTPRFAMHTAPNPSTDELQQLFGMPGSSRPGYYLSYPVTGHIWANTPESQRFDFDEPIQTGNPSSLLSSASTEPFLSLEASISQPALLRNPLVFPNHFFPANSSHSLSSAMPAHLDNEFDWIDPDIGIATLAGLEGISNEFLNPDVLSIPQKQDLAWSTELSDERTFLDGGPTPLSMATDLPALGVGVSEIPGDIQISDSPHVNPRENFDMNSDVEAHRRFGAAGPSVSAVGSENRRPYPAHAETSGDSCCKATAFPPQAFALSSNFPE